MGYLGVCRVFAFLLLVFPAVAACADVRGAAVVRQDIAVSLEPDRHLVAGKSIITFAAGTRSVSLRLSETAKIESVAVAGKRGPFSFTGGILSLELPAGGEALPVQVSYHAVFNDPVSQHPAASEDPSYGVNGAITREGTFLGEGAFWYPVPAQTPLQRSISIAAPAGTEALTAGRRVSRETKGAVTRSVWEELRPIGVLSLCAGPYRIAERRLDGIDIYTYFYPDNAALAPRYLDAAARYLSLYVELFGRYPYEKFAAVENFFPTGYGFPSFTLLGGSVIRLPFIIDTSFPHEIAHSWWGTAVQVDPHGGNWSEGLATYLADYLLKERRSKAEAADYRRQLLVDYASLVTPATDFPLNAFLSRSDPASRAIGYGKGALVFHMVRRQIGDDAFFEALRQICRDRLYREASWGDFIRAFSKSSGRDLSPYLKEWISRPGGPRLSFSEVTSRREADGWTVSGTILQTPPLFEIGVPLRLETSAAKLDKEIRLAGERTRFAITTRDKPKRLQLDPDAETFRILGSGEISATVNSIKGSTKLVGVITENCRASSETFHALLASLSQGGAPVIKEAELDRGAAQKDLIFCGLPRDRALLPDLPEGVELAQASFSLERVPFSAADALLFLVMQRRGGSGSLAALFQPLSEAAAVKYAPKITHYGKYGYLTFSAGANRQKGTVAAPGAGTVVELNP